MRTAADDRPTSHDLGSVDVPRYRRRYRIRSPEVPMSRIWFVTGASSGFGRAITEAALAEGETVVAAVRRPEALDDLVAAHADLIDPIALDVTDPAAVGPAVDGAIARHGRIDVLVNNAGRTQVGAVEETTD